MSQQRENERGGNLRGVDDSSNGDPSEPDIPSGVLRGIDDMVMDRTASAEEVEDVLKF